MPLSSRSTYSRFRNDSKTLPTIRPILLSRRSSILASQHSCGTACKLRCLQLASNAHAVYLQVLLHDGITSSSPLGRGTVSSSVGVWDLEITGIETISIQKTERCMIVVGKSVDKRMKKLWLKSVLKKKKSWLCKGRICVGVIINYSMCK